jgi:hypothetical protein
MTMEQGFIDIRHKSIKYFVGKSGNHWDRSASKGFRQASCLAVHRHNPWFFTRFYQNQSSLHQL